MVEQTVTLRHIAHSTFAELGIEQEYLQGFLSVIGDQYLNKSVAEIHPYDFDDDMSEIIYDQEKRSLFNGQQAKLMLFLTTFNNRVYYFTE